MKLATQNVLAGSGTEADPYLIRSVDDWCTLASSVELYYPDANMTINGLSLACLKAESSYCYVPEMLKIGSLLHFYFVERILFFIFAEY